jgi:hypothetical protein
MIPALSGPVQEMRPVPAVPANADETPSRPRDITAPLVFLLLGLIMAALIFGL